MDMSEDYVFVRLTLEFTIDKNQVSSVGDAIGEVLEYAEVPYNRVSQTAYLIVDGSEEKPAYGKVVNL